MKTLGTFLNEAEELQQNLIEQQVVVGNITNADIFDAIAEAVGDQEISEEDLTDIYNDIVEALTNEELEEVDEETLSEAHDIELKPHPNGKGTHYIVHKINDKSIDSEQLKPGESLSDTHVDDLKDMGYKVKIHGS